MVVDNSGAGKIVARVRADHDNMRPETKAALEELIKAAYLHTKSKE